MREHLKNDPELLLAIVLSCAIFAVSLSAYVIVSAAILGGYIP